MLVFAVLAACFQPKPAVPPAPPAAAEAPAPPAEPVPRDPTEPRYAATALLVAWKGAVDAPSSVTRTREEAATRAHQLRARAAAGEDLAALARSSSDDASAGAGG